MIVINASVKPTFFVMLIAFNKCRRKEKLEKYCNHATENFIIKSIILNGAIFKQ